MHRDRCFQSLRFLVVLCADLDLKFVLVGLGGWHIRKCLDRLVFQLVGLGLGGVL